MNCTDTSEVDMSEIGKRQQLAVARRRREDERRALLDKFVDNERRADRLRNWISAYTRFDKNPHYPELQRMFEWAEIELAELDTFLDPELLGATLRDRHLFPKTDPLSDPLGDSPSRRFRGGCPAPRTEGTGQLPIDTTLAIR